MILFTSCLLLIISYCSGLYLHYYDNGIWKWYIKYSSIRKVIFLYVGYFFFILGSFLLWKFFNVYNLQFLVLIFVAYNIAIIDFYNKKIPNELVVFLIAVRLLFLGVQWLVGEDLLLQNVIISLSGFFIAGVILIIAKIISKDGLGAGDIKLFMAIGFWIGYLEVIEVIIATFFLSMIGTIILLVMKKVKMKDTIPLAPFVVLGLIFKELYNIILF